MSSLLERLADQRHAVYVGGVLAIIGFRVAPPPGMTEPVRSAAVSVILGTMTLTYGAELWLGADGDPGRPVVLGLGVTGVIAGAYLTLTDAFVVGLLFLGGGLLFVRLGIAEDAGESS